MDVNKLLFFEKVFKVLNYDQYTDEDIHKALVPYFFNRMSTTDKFLKEFKDRLPKYELAQKAMVEATMRRCCIDYINEIITINSLAGNVLVLMKDFPEYKVLIGKSCQVELGDENLKRLSLKIVEFLKQDLSKLLNKDEISIDDSLENLVQKILTIYSETFFYDDLYSSLPKF